MTSSTSKLRVFVSSTCYDLLDLRAELRSFLEDNAFSVSLSEDPNSPFVVDPTDNSIASCLNNVESSDVVVCIVDRRYGGLLTLRDFGGLSASHAEVRKARELTRPVFFFIRDRAWLEYQQLQGDTSYDTKWVEPRNPDARRKWFDFVAEASKLPKTHSLSNWCDTFSSSVDLKSLVLKRLCDHFPQHIGAKSLMPDRLVRLSYVHSRITPTTVGGPVQVFGHFRNVGVGPALDIRHGYAFFDDRDGGAWKQGRVWSYGALAEKEDICQPPSPNFEYVIPPNIAPKLFCEYSNRFGDRYRVEMLLRWGVDGYELSGPEQFVVVDPIPLTNVTK